MENKIKINGDFSQLIAGIKSTSQAINTLSKERYKIKIDDSFAKEINQNITDYQSQLKDNLSNLLTQQKVLWDKIKQTQSGALDPKKLDEYIKGWDELNKKISYTATDLKNIENIKLQKPGAGQMGGGESRSLTNKIGTLIGSLAGIAGIGGGALAGIYALGSQRREIAKEGVTLAGMGVATKQSEIDRISNLGTAMGYKRGETLQQAVELQRQIGGNIGTQRKELGGVSNIEAIQRLQRGTGAEIGQLIGMAGGLRRSGLSDTQSVKKLQDVMAQAQVLGYDKSTAPEFAQEQINYLEQMSKLGADSAQGINQLNSILGRSDFFKGMLAQRGEEARRGLEGMLGAKEGPAAMAMYKTMQELPTTEGKKLSNVEMLSAMKDFEKDPTKFFKMFGDKGIKYLLDAIGEITYDATFDLQKMTEGQKSMMTLRIQEFTGWQSEMAKAFLESVVSSSGGAMEIAEKANRSKEKMNSSAANAMKTFDGGMLKLEKSMNDMILKLGEYSNQISQALGSTVMSWGTLLGGAGGVLSLLSLLKFGKLGKLLSSSGSIIGKSIEAAETGVGAIAQKSTGLLSKAAPTLANIGKSAGIAGLVTSVLAPTELAKEADNTPKNVQERLNVLKEKLAGTKDEAEKEKIRKEMQEVFAPPKSLKTEIKPEVENPIKKQIEKNVIQDEKVSKSKEEAKSIGQYEKNGLDATNIKLDEGNAIQRQILEVLISSLSNTKTTIFGPNIPKNLRTSSPVVVGNAS